MDKVMKELKKLANNLSDYPFKDMPFTNGSLLASVVPCLFVMVGSKFAILYGVWHIFFCISIILDKGANSNASRRN